MSRRQASALAVVFAAAVSLPAAEKSAPNGQKVPEGFTPLFNGKDLAGWQAAIRIDQRQKMSPEQLKDAQEKANAKVLPHWKAEGGVLVNDGEGDNLATTRDFHDFELYVDWKIEPKGDSGIYLRGIPQVQIWDSETLTGNLAKDRGKGSGGLWNNSKDNQPLKNADRPAGEWNTFHITMKGDRVSVRLNGQLVVDGVALENIWEKGKPLPEKGPIELQRHPKQDGTLGKLWFRNVYLKELK